METRCPYSVYGKKGLRDQGWGKGSRKSRRQEVWGRDPCWPPGGRCSSFSPGPTGSHPPTALSNYRYQR